MRINYNEINNKISPKPFYKKTKFVIYSFLILLIIAAINYGIRHLPITDFHVVHERQPPYVRLSDGSIQNKYVLKLLNKTDKAINVKFSASGLESMTTYGLSNVMPIAPRKTILFTAFIRIDDIQENADISPIYFKSKIQGVLGSESTYQSVFFTP